LKKDEYGDREKRTKGPPPYLVTKRGVSNEGKNPAQKGSGRKRKRSYGFREPARRWGETTIQKQKGWEGIRKGKRTGSKKIDGLSEGGLERKRVEGCF